MVDRGTDAVDVEDTEGTGDGAANTASANVKYTMNDRYIMTRRHQGSREKTCTFQWGKRRKRKKRNDSSEEREQESNCMIWICIITILH